MRKDGCVCLYIGYKVDTYWLLIWAFPHCGSHRRILQYRECLHAKAKETFILNISKCIAIVPSASRFKGNFQILWMKIASELGEFSNIGLLLAALTKSLFSGPISPSQDLSRTFLSMFRFLCMGVTKNCVSLCMLNETG